MVLFAVFILAAWTTGKISSNLNPEYGRFEVWKKTVRLTNQKPWTGWGPATYKAIFPALGHMKSRPWNVAHNDWLQILFQIGYPMYCLFLFCVLAYTSMLFWHCDKVRDYRLLAGGAMIALDMVVHFPSYMIETVPLMLVFLAYCEATIIQKKKRVF